jgi:hypothetical protein
MTTQTAVLFILVAAFVGFIAGALMGDAFKWHYKRKRLTEAEFADLVNEPREP